MTKYSISPLNNQKYSFQDENDNDLDIFLQLNKNKQIVVVQGLGFVGSVMSLVCSDSEANYAVIGLDLASEESYWKVGMFKEGKLPIESSDPKVSELFEKSKQNNSFFATTDKKALSHADYVIVDINLDLTKEKNKDEEIVGFEVPIEGFKSAINDIGSLCKEEVLVLVETTVPPGTCKNIVQPILIECLKKRGLCADKIAIGHSYERVMPGPNYVDSIKNFYRVFSGLDDKSAMRIEDFLKTIISVDEYPLTKLPNTQSTEMAKVLENSYRALNISFIVEWSRLAEDASVDLYDVVDAIRMRPTHNNMMYPGIGVGGYCLTKDPLIASWASREFFDSNSLPFSRKSVEENDQMPSYAFSYLEERILKKNNVSNVAILGVAYGPGIGDTRFTPVYNFTEHLKNYGLQIDCFDPYVTYWEEQKIRVSNEYKKICQNDYDLIIITTKHKEFVNSTTVMELVEDGVLVYDTVGCFDNRASLSKYDNYYLLGSGLHGK